LKGYDRMNDTVTHEPPCWYLRDADVPLIGGELGVCLAAAVEVLPLVERKKAWRRRRLSVRVVFRMPFAAACDVIDPSCSVGTAGTGLNNVRFRPGLTREGAAVQVRHGAIHRTVERCRQPAWGAVPERRLGLTSRRYGRTRTRMPSWTWFPG